jgi:hypothetical protein
MCEQDRRLPARSWRFLLPGRAALLVQMRPKWPPTFDNFAPLPYTPLLSVSDAQSSVAQSAERAAVNRNVVGSSPTRGA